MLIIARYCTNCKSQKKAASLRTRLFALLFLRLRFGRLRGLGFYLHYFLRLCHNLLFRRDFLDGMFQRHMRRGLWVDAWTIDDPAEMQILIGIGVDGIITDRPDLLMDVLGR